MQVLRVHLAILKLLSDTYYHQKSLKFWENQKPGAGNEIKLTSAIDTFFRLSGYLLENLKRSDMMLVTNLDS